MRSASRLSIGAFAVLVAATIAAFFVTQHLKVTTPLIQGFPRPVPGVINPVRGGLCFGRNNRSTTISFYLQHRSDDVDVYVVSARTEERVDQVASGRHMRRDVRHPDGVFHWNGRLTGGSVAPDGSYFFRVALLHQGRTIDLSGVPVRVKTVPPHPVITRVSPTAISAVAGSRVTIEYAGNERRSGTILLYRLGSAGGPRLVKTFVTPWNGHTAVWDGTIHGRPAPAGKYLIGIEVMDAACNTGRWPARVPPPAGVADHAIVTVT